MVYDISYKTLLGSKPFLIRLHELGGFIRVYVVIKYLVLFDSEKYDAIPNRISYLKSRKSDTTYVFFHNCASVKIGFYDSLPLEKTLTLRNVIILIKSIVIIRMKIIIIAIYWKILYKQNEYDIL